MPVLHGRAVGHCPYQGRGLHGARRLEVYGQGDICGPRDLLSALQPPWLGCGDGGGQQVWEQIVMPEGQEQTSITTWTVGQKGRAMVTAHKGAARCGQSRAALG